MPLDDGPLSSFGKKKKKPDSASNIVELASGKPIEQIAWFTRLQRSEKGAFLPTAANAITILSNDPALNGMLAFNAFTSAPLLMKAPPVAEDGAPMPGPYPRPWGTEDAVLFQAYMQRIWSPKFSRSTIEDAMLSCAAQKQFHPVRQWMERLIWDGIERIDTWLTQAFGAENTAYHQAVGAKFLIAAVRRIRNPGCKFDHMLVLEGLQGIGKSTALRTLFSDAWFSDAIPPDLANRDAAMALLGIWCLEFSEIEHLIRSEIETVKAFLSRSVDRYRPPYGKQFVERPRQGILVGTTNSDEYLRDSTGNRRIWPVKCHAASAEWISTHREQLWAEAVHREATGEAIWLTDGEVQFAADTAQQSRMNEDVWHDLVQDWLIGRADIKIATILTDALNVPVERQGRMQQNRVAAILRNLGWEKAVKWLGHPPKATKVWCPKNDIF